MFNTTTGEYSPFVKEEKTTGDVNSNFSIKADQQGLSAGNAGYNSAVAELIKKIEKLRDGYQTEWMKRDMVSIKQQIEHDEIIKRYDNAISVIEATVSL